ncbi:hypothetical protein EUTSA_v10000638mg [Eutrema salsugineum]|uniref:F-box associated beta-propeller type 1 domain-containing protein n=1 Tax=Eutrema salsugineum TaxID=72664 RepID=V4LQJ2_EUTSA|nr:hypothetical protein EUTSA_v10000638mg [Eutrema salsugineum]
MAEEIFSRIPLRYLRAVRLTCKKWDKLSKIQVYRFCYGVYRYRYALGYSKNNKNKKKKSLGSHKILRFVDDYLCMATRPRHQFLWYEIYDFSTGLWKTLDITSPYWKILSTNLGVSLKGNTYWISYDREPTFGPLLDLPLPGLVEGEHATLSCVREEKLALLFQYDEAPMVDIWITNKIESDENVLWSKFLAVNMETIAHVPISFRHADFYIDEEKRLAFVFDKTSDKHRHTVNIIGEDGYFRELDLGEDGSAENYCWRTLVCSHVPSLVQIKQLCKRKQQSSLEMRRCDKKSSRFEAMDKRIKQEQELRQQKLHS